MWQAASTIATAQLTLKETRYVWTIQKGPH